jgi:hypothetical protein
MARTMHTVDCGLHYAPARTSARRAVAVPVVGRGRASLSTNYNTCTPNLAPKAWHSKLVGGTRRLRVFSPSERSTHPPRRTALFTIELTFTAFCLAL